MHAMHTITINMYILSQNAIKIRVGSNFLFSCKLNNLCLNHIEMTERTTIGTGHGLCHSYREMFLAGYGLRVLGRRCPTYVFVFTIRPWTRPTVTGRSYHKNGPQEHQHVEVFVLSANVLIPPKPVSIQLSSFS